MRGSGRVKQLLRRTSPRDGRALEELGAYVLGEEPLRLVDVGALGGLLLELDPIQGHLDAVGFDPDPAECERLNQDARSKGLPHRFLPYAVAGSDGKRAFHVLRKEASSSLLKPNREYHDRFPDAQRMDVMRVAEVETRSLGPLLEQESVRPELLKLDAHGVENEILESLTTEQWHDLNAVHVELLLAEHYIGQTSLGAVHDRLRAAGLELYSLRRYASRRAGFDAGRYRSRGQLAFADGVYFRRTRDLETRRRRRLALLAAAFRHYDFALELLGSDERARALVLYLADHKGRGPWASDGANDWI